MIKANELRIGNYFHPVTTHTETHMPATGVVMQITELKLFTVSAILYGYNPAQVIHEELRYADLSPIPLTPEILEQCGFEKSVNEMNIDGIEMNLHISGEEIPYGTWFTSCGSFNGGLCVLCLCKGNYFANNIGYLHELQNLYISLTGEELKLQITNDAAHV